MTVRDELAQMLADGRTWTKGWDIPTPDEKHHAKLFAEWLAAHDGDLRERIAQAIEAANWGHSADIDWVQAGAANIARAGGKA
jgi:hypothetical protein